MAHCVTPAKYFLLGQRGAHLAAQTHVARIYLLRSRYVRIEPTQGNDFSRAYETGPVYEKILRWERTLIKNVAGHLPNKIC